MPRKIGKYTFPNPTCISDAKPPRNISGVYVLLVKTSEGSNGAVRYIGSTKNLADRVNWGHEKAKDLLNEAGRDPERVLVTWIEIPRKSEYFSVEEELIKHFGGKVVNNNKIAK